MEPLSDPLAAPAAATGARGGRLPVVAVVGGGVSGLAAAWYVLEEAAAVGVPVHVVVLEASRRLGGALSTGMLGEVRLDLGAESLLARRPEALDLVHAAGLSDDLVHPATATATIWSRGHRHRIPEGLYLGVPSQADSLLGVLSGPEVALAGREPADLTAPVDDVPVAAFVERRLGKAVVDRLVEPFLGGVYAGHAQRLSLQATMPDLWRHLRGATTLQAAARRVIEEGSQRGGGPVFAGIRGGVGRLPAALADAVIGRGGSVRSGVTVRELIRRDAGGWRLECGPVPQPSWLDADAVVLAVPASRASRLLRPHAPLAAVRLGSIQTASVALVTALLPRALLATTAGSGILVPPVENLAVKAVTYASAKWSWVDEQDRDHAAVRLSLGRCGEEAVLQRDDSELIDVAMADLAHMLGRYVRPFSARVVRWGGALPQYAVGHVDLVAAVRQDVASVPGLAVCGAYLDGVGVPACAAAARRAAHEVMHDLAAGWERMEP